MDDKSNDKKSSIFGLGVVIGSVLGGLAAFFLSPKSGKENKEMVLEKLEALKKMLVASEAAHKIKEIYGEVSQDSVKLYNQMKKKLIKRIEELKEKVEDIDREKYTRMVEDVADEVKKDTKTTAEKLAKIKESLLKDWHKLTTPKKAGKK